MSRVAIIGAGPTGLIAAETLANAGVTVTIYERMAAPARKFLLAGRGGLNLTHSETLTAFKGRYDGSVGASNFVDDFSPDALIAWAAALGQETFIGSSGRVFPKAMKASPLLRAWLRRLQTLGVELKLSHRWTGFDQASRPLIAANGAHAHAVCADATLLALGGASWPKLGSDGVWVTILQNFSVDVAPLMPANAGVCIDWPGAIKDARAGLPLKRVAISCRGETVRGEAMITRTGLQGGAIYALGRAIRRELHLNGSARLIIDLAPDQTAAEIEQRLARPRAKQSLSTYLRKALTLDVAKIAIVQHAMRSAHSANLIPSIKSAPLTVTGFESFERAISTAGGISAAALDNNLMLTRLPGVFAAGEMLDWEAPTGGYLLQACFASGVAAANGILRWLETERDFGHNAGSDATPSPPIDRK